MVSVIIPTYNSAVYIQESIKSVTAQTYFDWECIIIDDGSMDETDVLVKGEMKADKRIKYIPQENRGVSVARNNGIHEASGEYLLFLDADDTLNPLALEKMTSIMDNDSDVLLVYSDAVIFGNSQGYSNLKDDFTIVDLLKRNQMFVTNLVRRKDIGDTIRFDPNISSVDEDWEFWIQLFSTYPKRRKIKIDYPVFNYRKHDNSNMLKLKSQSEKRKKAFDYVYMKHRDLYNNFFPDFITTMNRKDFYEQKLTKIYNSFPYRIYSKIASFLK